MDHCDSNCKECVKTKNRTLEEKKKITKRLNIILGQVKGIQKMVDEDRYCNDILIQIRAIDKSLKSLGNEILKSHLRTCVVEEIKKDNLTVVDEIAELFESLNK